MSSAGDVECTLKEVSISLKIPVPTVSRVIREFIDNDDTVVAFKKGPRVEPVPIAVQDKLLSQELLE